MDPFLLVHILVGVVALVTFWLALGARKGRGSHRVVGRVFFAAMLLVVVTVAPLLVTDRPLDPGRVVQLVYLSACVASVVALGWTSVRWRRAPERFASLPLRGVGAVLTGLGGVVLLAGLLTANPVAAVLSWVGLAFGSAMVRSHGKRGASNGWLQWHLDAVCGLLTAVHGTLAYVAWRGLVAPGAGPWTAAGFHVGVLVIAIVVRAWLARRYRTPSLVFVAPTPTWRPTGARRGSRPGAPSRPG
ncbi:MAG: hypothetical protein H6735_15355 [Alphaproteobacteria bacterium]|nr:hypothetical protein [Alphaproteobacteria bacterium]